MQTKRFLNLPLVLILYFASILNGFSSGSAPIKLFYITDDQAKYTNNDIRQLYNENKLKKSALNFNISYSANKAWFVVDLDSISGDSRVLILDNAHVDSIDLFYYAGNDLIKIKKSGDHFDFDTRDFNNNFFSFVIPPQTSQLIIKVATEGVMIIPIKVQTYQEYLGWKGITAFHWVFFALILFSLLMNLFLYFWLKEKFYIYYLFSLFSAGFITAADFGYTFQYLWPHYPEMNNYNHLYYYFSVFPLLFLEKILNIKKDFPVLHRIFQSIYLVTFCAAVISFFIPYWVSIKVVYYIFIFITLYSLFCSGYVYRRYKQEYSQFILIGMLIYFITSFIYIFAIGAFIEYDSLANHLVQIGTAIQIVFINLATLSKIKSLKRENERLLIEQNKTLEKMVMERTIELKQSKDEITAQKKSIEEKNITLKEHQENLEKLIGERTEELKLMNTDLVDKNNRLEQFAFVTAHNLRGPVATILGLCQIFDKKSITDAYNLGLLDNVEEITKKLDGIIKDLSVLLDLEKNIQSINETVLLKGTLDEVKVLLHNEIKESGAIITDNFVELEKIDTVPSYLNNIFYNLISNSIKFRRYNATPEIRIMREAGPGYYSIAFQDNGAGIDMTKYGTNVGNPYKRFHPDIKGKGLGLYITKKQIEAMNGSIEINSSMNKGTTIKVILKTPTV